MAWPEWNLALAPEIARFVNPTEAVRTGLRPRAAGDLRHDPAGLANAIYDTLRARNLGYTSTVIGEHGNQAVQTPEETLEHGTPNCIDLTTLIAAACLSAELVPLIALLTKADNSRHALVWLVPNADARARKTTDLGRIGGVGHIVKQGRAEIDELTALADAQAWIPIEATGVCRSMLWAEPDGVARSIPFDEAVTVAHEVLAGATKIDLVDVHRLQRDGLQPWTPPELVAARRQQRNRRVTTAASGAMIVLLAVTLVVWKPWVNDLREPMTGGFNVAVAGLRSGDSESERGARTVPTHLADALATQYESDPRYLVWGPDEVGAVDAADADEVAAEIRSDVLVYGEMAVDTEDDDVYAVDVRVNSSQHAARAPWPLSIDESVGFEVPIANVTAGVFDESPSIVSLTRTLDGMAALLADAHDAALDRLVAAQDAVGDAGPALIPALRAWTLLAQAGFDGDAAAVAEARLLADEAMRRDPTSEFARIVSVSVDYMTIIPAQANTAVAGCALPPVTARPELDAVVALRDRITGMIPELSPTGQIQLTSILGRLAVSEALLTSDGSAIDLTPAEGLFTSIIERAGDDPALRIWTSDAHRWLGLLADVDPATPLGDVLDHFVASADVATPIWKSRAYGLAGRAARCDQEPSIVDAVCFFERAIRDAPAEDSIVYRAAIAEIDASCPDGWTVSDR